MLKRLKLSALAAAKAGGLSERVASGRWRRERLLILGYHSFSVAGEHLWDGHQFLAPGLFRERMRALKDLRASVLPLGEAVERLHAGDLPERAVALTFDDGTADFRAAAYPVLREFGFPATLYLTTFYTEFARPVFDLMVSYLLWLGRGRTLDLDGLTAAGGRVALASEAARDAARDLVFARARERRLSAEEKDALAAELAARVGADYAALNARRALHNLTPAEVREVSDGGVDVELHTHRHRVPRDRALFLREIDDNRASLRRMTGKDAVHFCYPSGVTDPMYLPWLEERGIASATTCETGLAARTSHRLLLPRLLDVTRLTPLEFEGWVTGTAAFLPRRGR